jgi:glyoxylase-like metal-dependent hydrolase (beta-lactamase superfamily II)
MRIHHLNAATMCPLGARLVTGTGGWLGRARMISHVLLLETAHGVVLVDAGLGTLDLANPELLGSWVRKVSPRLDPSETVLSQLSVRGLSARDVTHIVPTHLDLDHAGGITDFLHATVHVHEREHDAAFSDAHWRYRQHQLRGARWRTFGDGGERWYGFDGVRELFAGDPDILLVPLPGHTAGHTGVAVRKGGGWLLHAGDAYFAHGEIGSPRRTPPLIRAFQRRLDVDRATRLANRDRLAALVREHHDVQVFCSHDAFELDQALATTEQVRGDAA